MPDENDRNSNPRSIGSPPWPPDGSVHVAEEARDQLIGVEHLGDEELEGLRQTKEVDAGSKVTSDRSGR